MRLCGGQIRPSFQGEGEEMASFRRVREENDGE